MNQLKGLEQAKMVLSEKLKYAIGKINPQEAIKIQELRLRIGKYFSVCILDKEYFITEAGKLTQFHNNGILVDGNDINFTFKVACQYSVHSFQKELSQGFITIQGGNRIGLCGSAVINKNEVETIKDISSINIRIAKQIIGCSNNIYSSLFCGQLQSVLIIGPPLSGKTTILRDLCRQLGQAHKLSIIDERNEIAATVNGIPQNDIGLFSDVFNSYPKVDGIITAIRVMSPKIIVCDEIGSNEDAIALENAIHSGVKIIATAHAGSIEEIKKRIGLMKLLELGAFNKIALLGTGEKIGEVIKIHTIGDEND